MEKTCVKGSSIEGKKPNKTGAEEWKVITTVFQSKKLTKNLSSYLLFFWQKFTSLL